VNLPYSLEQVSFVRGAVEPDVAFSHHPQPPLQTLIRVSFRNGVADIMFSSWSSQHITLAFCH